VPFSIHLFIKPILAFKSSIQEAKGLRDKNDFSSQALGI